MISEVDLIINDVHSFYLKKNLMWMVFFLPICQFTTWVSGANGDLMKTLNPLKLEFQKVAGN